MLSAVYYRRRYPLAAMATSPSWFCSLLLRPSSHCGSDFERRIYLPMIGLLLIAIDLIRRLSKNQTFSPLGASC